MKGIHRAEATRVEEARLLIKGGASTQAMIMNNLSQDIREDTTSRVEAIIKSVEHTINRPTEDTIKSVEDIIHSPVEDTINSPEEVTTKNMEDTKYSPEEDTIKSMEDTNSPVEDMRELLEGWSITLLRECMRNMRDHLIRGILMEETPAMRCITRTMGDPAMIIMRMSTMSLKRRTTSALRVKGGEHDLVEAHNMKGIRRDTMGLLKVEIVRRD